MVKSKVWLSCFTVVSIGIWEALEYLLPHPDSSISLLSWNIYQSHMDISDKVKYLKQHEKCWRDQLNGIFIVYDLQMNYLFL